MTRNGSDTLDKSERISSQLTIDRLFSGSNPSVMAYPFRVVYMPQSGNTAPPSILISIPKRRLHHAVDRNRMKRLVREAYRRQKHTLCQALAEQQASVAIAFVCISTTTVAYNTVYASVGKALARIVDTVTQPQPQSADDTTAAVAGEDILAGS